MFSLDGKLMSFISRVGDLLILNVLYVICCIPIITIGVATTALYAVTKKMAANEEGYIVRTFFKQFKENFVKSTIMWFIMLVILAVAVLDYMIGNAIPNETFQYLFKGAMMLIMILAVGAMMYALTIQCTFENTLKNNLKNAALMVILHFPWTIVIVLLTLTPVLAVLFFTKYLPYELMAMVCIWFSLVAYINSFIFNHIYKKYM